MGHCVQPLLTLACDSLLKIIQSISNLKLRQGFVESLGANIAEKLLDRTIENDSDSKWKEEWKCFLTSKIRRASISWEKKLIKCLISKNLRLVRVLDCDQFDSTLISILPSSVNFLFFDIFRNMGDSKERKHWLPEAEEILRSILKPPKQLLTEPISGPGLTEIDLESVSATSKDLQEILKNSPNLRILRHYQMVKALYDLHVDAWKQKQPLPKYKLKNLDLDFSHVIRCRMSPEWVLAPDALQLATLLCPQAVEIHLRFDCSTPNDVLTPLLNLERIKKFSAVCVTSGERTNLDFSDMTPVLEKFGPTSLNFLELKVIEEVEVHVVVEWCTRLETIILSGCGYVTPSTCPSYQCHTFKPEATFTRLKHLFFADGDDFSWDHGAPECFWKAALHPNPLRKSPLRTLILEFPRIPDSLTAKIFYRTSENSALPFPELRVVSFCRYNELTLEDITSFCGLEKSENPPISFLRISDCEKFPASEDKKLRNWFKQRGIDCQVVVDVDPEAYCEQKKPYTFKICRPR